MVSACPDTTNVKLAGVHDGMELLARNTTEPTPGLIGQSARPLRLAASFISNKTRDVRFWHLTDMTYCAACLLLTQGGHHCGARLKNPRRRATTTMSSFR